MRLLSLILLLSFAICEKLSAASNSDPVTAVAEGKKAAQAAKRLAELRQTVITAKAEARAAYIAAAKIRHENALIDPHPEANTPGLVQTQSGNPLSSTNPTHVAYVRAKQAYQTARRALREAEQALASAMP